MGAVEQKRCAPVMLGETPFLRLWAETIEALSLGYLSVDIELCLWMAMKVAMAFLLLLVAFSLPYVRVWARHLRAG